MTAESTGTRLPGVGILLGGLLAGACGAPPLPPPQTAQPTPTDLRAEALLIEYTTRVAQPSRIVFRWRAQEPGPRRHEGTGVARVEPPYRARLDLFLDNGEAAAIAVLVEDELRIPASLPTELVPPAPLMWAVFGVFRPGAGARMAEGRITRGTMELEYELPSLDRVRFHLRDRAVVNAERLERGSVVETVFISDREGATIFPEEATYRNLPGYRELRLTLESIEHVDAFPPDIWYPNQP
ncbi:MAG: hypothetical protein OXF01_04430 [Gemmatimonadetes bacterium]|nr:hypothetical protein [Gemmatimonadota bacterium]